MKDKTILFQGNSYPVIQNIAYTNYSDAINCRTGNIEIVYDHQTGLIYNNCFDESIVEYTVDYDNEQGNSETFKSHLNQVADLVQENIGNESIVEVGCGKGVFLELLLSRGVEVVGFDPTYVGLNPRVTKKFFEFGIIEKPSKGLVLRHVLEHICNPYDFLCQLREANGNQGLIYIEVPCFDWICSHGTWYDLFYEHVNYFRLEDFYKMFSRIKSIGRIFGEQYLYVIADLSSLTEPVNSVNSTFCLPPNFFNSMIKIGDRVEDGPICVWGAGSKGVIFSLLLQRLGKKVNLVIDVNPSKQGKFLPVTGLEVKSPEMGLVELPKGSTIYVMNSNYLEEIKESSGNAYSYFTVDTII